jgi:hypothetical protein
LHSYFFFYSIGASEDILKVLNEKKEEDGTVIYISIAYIIFLGVLAGDGDGDHHHSLQHGVMLASCNVNLAFCVAAIMDPGGL